MQIMIEVQDDLFNHFKKIAEKKNFSLNDLNMNIFEKAVQNWIFNNDEELDVLDKLDMFMAYFLDGKKCG